MGCGSSLSLPSFVVAFCAREAVDEVQVLQLEIRRVLYTEVARAFGGVDGCAVAVAAERDVDAVHNNLRALEIEPPPCA